MTAKMLEQYCKLDEESEGLMKIAFEKYHISARGYTRLLKVARTIADLDNSEIITFDHIAEAIAYRNIEKYQL